MQSSSLSFIAAVFPLLSFTLSSAIASPAEATPVKVATVKRGDIVRYVTLPGNLRANQQVSLYAKVTGYITKLNADIGDQVKTNEVLAELEVPELLADQKKYEADVKVRNIDLQRLTEAQRKAQDLVLPQAVDQARAADDMAKAELERVNTLLGFAKIVAPFDGIVTMRYVDSGAFVPAATARSQVQNSAVFSIADYNTIRATVSVPEADAALVTVGQPVQVKLDALRGRVIAAKVSRFAHDIDEATRTMLVQADIPNANGQLRPGMYAIMKIGVESHSNAVLVPVSAIVTEKLNAFVFKDVDGKARKTPVTLGFNDGSNAEVLSGLNEGESVILADKLGLTDSQPVQASGATTK